MLPHDELFHYGVRGMRWGVRKRMGVDTTPEKKAAEKNYADFKSGKIGDRAYSRKEARIRQALRNKTTSAVQKERKQMGEERRAKAAAKINAMPKGQAKADALIVLNNKQQGLYNTRKGAVEARMKALQKAGFSNKQAARGRRSYEYAMGGVSAGILAGGLKTAYDVVKGKDVTVGSVAYNYLVGMGVGAAAGRVTAYGVSKKKKEGSFK